MSKIKVETTMADKVINLGRQSDGSLYGLTLKDMGSMIIGALPGMGKTELLKNIALQASEIAQVFVIDPKRVGYLTIKDHKNINVITKMERVPKLLQTVVNEINSRYTYMEKNNTDECPFGRILLCFDELAEVFWNLSDNDKEMIRQILSLGRQCGISVAAATQQPNRRTFSGAILDLFITRCALRTSTGYASKVILEKKGAEHLPKYSAIVAGVMGFQTQIRLLPPVGENGEIPEELPSDTIEWEDE